MDPHIHMGRVLAEAREAFGEPAPSVLASALGTAARHRTAAFALTSLRREEQAEIIATALLRQHGPAMAARVLVEATKIIGER